MYVNIANTRVYNENILSFPLITLFLTKTNPIKPDKNATIAPNITFKDISTFPISKIPAPNVTGRLIKNEYLTADFFVMPNIKAANKVAPLREIPGRIAKA